jgi:hypothetical protein
MPESAIYLYKNVRIVAGIITALLLLIFRSNKSFKASSSLSLIARVFKVRDLPALAYIFRIIARISSI